MRCKKSISSYAAPIDLPPEAKYKPTMPDLDNMTIVPNEKFKNRLKIGIRCLKTANGKLTIDLENISDSPKRIKRKQVIASLVPTKKSRNLPTSL